MEHLFDILVPLVFVVIYFFGNMLSKKGEEDTRPEPRHRPKPDYTPTQYDLDYAERQRRIQEEIRRKIEARRDAAGESQAGSAPTSTPPPISDDLVRRRRAVQERLKERKEKQKETYESVHESTAHLSPTHQQQVETEPEGAFSWGSSENVYEQVMEGRLKQIEATKRQAEALRRQANATVRKQGRSTSDRPASTTGGRGLSGSVRDTLKESGAARAAFIYGEVLGQPLSLRKGEIGERF